MSNILDYLKWRGDLSAETVPFGEVDYIILCRMSYVPFLGLISRRFTERVTIAQAARDVLSQHRPLAMRGDLPLLELLSESARFGALECAGYCEEYDVVKQEQFAALTVFLPGNHAVAVFRGTDGTLVGWKEDFNMAFSDVVPAQLDAAEYVRALAELHDGDISLVGHSKGGNLAIYSGAFSSARALSKLRRIISFDGPGFTEDKIKSDAYLRAAPLMRTYVPQSSIIGMLLEHAEDYAVVESEGTGGLMQHDIYNWVVTPRGFVTLESLTNSSRLLDSTFKDWVRHMTDAQREQFVNGIFKVFEAVGAETFPDLLSKKNIIPMFRAASRLDPETRAVLMQAFSILKTSAKGALKAALERSREQ